jgi:hypothetical protein
VSKNIDPFCLGLLCSWNPRDENKESMQASIAGVIRTLKGAHIIVKTGDARVAYWAWRAPCEVLPERVGEIDNDQIPHQHMILERRFKQDDERKEFDSLPKVRRVAGPSPASGLHDLPSRWLPLLPTEL